MKPVQKTALLALFLVLAALPLPVLASRQGPSCDHAAANAASQTGVPEAILLAIARVEAGRQQGGGFAPWPWTVNQGGRGSFFDSRDLAVDHVKQALSAGETNIDIGCFQINWRWHNEAFPSVEAMFDPDRNALYAARFLQRLLAETGSWEGAIGAYHSRKSDAAEGYLTKVAQHLGAPGDPPAAAMSPAAPAAPRTNTYPLLQGGGGALGSLVAQDAALATPFLLR
ncbi:transglycosylase SLT domain-containing protein [Pseudotabrizicola sp. L79]|uniref:transglycosylase SLT domain-containing protein n=1 Tax=Pseudotabrizicola sp. L79 TaxID=3118402 RepID=UPI002F9565C3